MLRERHRINRVGWLRAAVLGANDGLLSTSSLILGVAAARGSHKSILVAGMAGLVAGAMSMAAGEYVSVHSQADTENADLERERVEISRDPAGEQKELTQIYVGRGLTHELAAQVASQMMAHNALEAHARDELGVTDALTARPVQAALASALLVCAFAPERLLIALVGVCSLVCLGALGGVAAQVGGAGIVKGSVRVIFWGVLAMAVTLGVGMLFGTKV
jgi:VIT1/CCC1 family predicted Fe2+/Mn2+ transporter